MNGTLFTAPGNDVNGIPTGSHFIAHERLEAAIDPLRGMKDEDFRGWFFERFRQAYNAKRPEAERLKMLELYYAGFHFLTPQMNREMKVTNLCFATVETVHPVMTEVRPRPEIVPRRQYQQKEVTAIQEYAQWLMDTAEFDLLHHVNTREKLKYGWCVHMLVVDPRTGICYAKPKSVFDFYPAPGAKHEDSMEFFFIAEPVPTDWLRERYPALAAKISSDNIASPGYDVLERPYFDAYDMGGEYSGLDRIMAGSAHLESEPDPGGAKGLVPSDGRDVQEGAGTTFLIQGFFRDRRMMEVFYRGDIAQPDPDTAGQFTHTPSMKPYRKLEPYCESGWCCVLFTWSGLRLDVRPLDPCFLGSPIEIGRDYAQLGRFYCPGELDHLVPVNRSLNRRYNLLNRSLEFEAVPILLADKGAGIDVDQAAVEPGDVLRPVRGSDVRWLDFRGASAQQFQLLTMEKLDGDTITGIHDVTQGRRPEGIEAASAIRNLEQAAERRIRGKEVPATIEYTRLLKKMMVATGKKAKQPIWFRGSNGLPASIDPAWLCYEYDVRFATGTGSVLGRAANEEKYQNAFQLGLIDQQTALEGIGMPNIPAILQRTAAQQAIQSRMAAAAGPARPPA